MTRAPVADVETDSGRAQSSPFRASALALTASASVGVAWFGLS